MHTQVTDASAAPQRDAGFYVELEELLLRRVRQQPDTREPRMRLLELYAQTGRAAEFAREAAALVHGLGAAAAAVPSAPVANEDLLARRFGDAHKYAPDFEQLATAYARVRADPTFISECDLALLQFAGRPSALHDARGLTQVGDGARLLIKREDQSPADQLLLLCIMCQALLAVRCERRELVTGSFSGQRGVLTAAAAAHFGLRAVVYMPDDVAASAGEAALRIKLMGGELRATREDPRKAALAHWRAHGESLMVTGLDGAPHPYPAILADAMSTVGRESMRQCLAVARRPPDLVVARDGDNADAISLFPSLLGLRKTRLVCVKTRKSFSQSGFNELLAAEEHAPAPGNCEARPDVRDALRAPSMAREHAWLRATGRIDYVEVDEGAARRAIGLCATQEGIIPTIPCAHVVAWGLEEARRLGKGRTVVLLLAASMPLAAPLPPDD